MEPQEIIYRIIETFKKIYFYFIRHEYKSFENKKYNIRYSTNLLNFIINNYNLTQINKINQIIFNKKLNLLGGIFSNIKIKIDTNNNIWFYNYSGKDEWIKKRFGLFINKKKIAEIDDVKLLWELNRLQFLQPLCFEMYLTKNYEKVELIENIIDDWIEKNQPFKGVNWSSGLEVAIRAINLVIILNFLKNKIKNKKKIIFILNASLQFLNMFPSLFSSSNNHYIAELVAKLLIMHTLSLNKNISSIRDKITNELPLQFHKDGTPKEQSPTYGAFSIELILLAIAVDKKLKRKIDQTILNNFSLFIKCISSGFYTSNIGDNDNGSVIFLIDNVLPYPLQIANLINKKKNTYRLLKFFTMEGIA